MKELILKDWFFFFKSAHPIKTIRIIYTKAMKIYHNILKYTKGMPKVISLRMQSKANARDLEEVPVKRVNSIKDSGRENLNKAI